MQYVWDTILCVGMGCSVLPKYDYVKHGELWKGLRLQDDIVYPACVEPNEEGDIIWLLLTFQKLYKADHVPKEV